MRRIVMAFMGTVSGLVLLFSYHTSTNATTTVAGQPTGGAGGIGGTGGAIPGTGSSSGSSSGSSGSSGSGSYTGAAAQTRWGIVQVQITVANGRITNSVAVQYPQGNSLDQEINAYALPQLSQEVLDRQSANIDAVSGATVTSNGYIQSLQSAIDQAHL